MPVRDEWRVGNKIAKSQIVEERLGERAEIDNIPLVIVSFNAGCGSRS